MTLPRSPHLALLSAVMAVGLLTGCGGAAEDRPSASQGAASETAPSQAPTPPGTVAMKDVEFIPDRLTVKVGEKVTWRNDEALDHNVVAQTGAKFQSRAFGEGGTYTFTPKKPGTIDYVCTLHPGMDGQIVVRR